MVAATAHAARVGWRGYAAALVRGRGGVLAGLGAYMAPPALAAAVAGAGGSGLALAVRAGCGPGPPPAATGCCSHR